MFMRLSWPKADDAGVVEFMFFFGLNVSPAGLTPLENICVQCSDGNEDQRHDDG
jgi:hypothetical protein